MLHGGALFNRSRSSGQQTTVVHAIRAHVSGWLGVKEALSRNSVPDDDIKNSGSCSSRIVQTL